MNSLVSWEFFLLGVTKAVGVPLSLGFLSKPTSCSSSSEDSSSSSLELSSLPPTRNQPITNISVSN